MMNIPGRREAWSEEWDGLVTVPLDVGVPLHHHNTNYNVQRGVKHNLFRSPGSDSHHVIVFTSPGRDLVKKYFLCRSDLTLPLAQFPDREVGWQEPHP